MLVKECKNGNLHIIKAFNKVQSFKECLVELINSVDGCDTYLASDAFCLGNDCGAYSLYNIRLEKAYTLTDRDILKLLEGKRVILYAYNPTVDEKRDFDEYLAL